MDARFTTPALAAFAAGRTVDPIGFLPSGRPVYPIAGGAEDVGTPGETAPLPTAEELQGMTDEQVEAARDAAMAESAELSDLDPATMTDAQMDRLDALADFAGDTADGQPGLVDSELTRRETVAAERTARAEAARGRLNREPEGDPDAGGEPGDPQAGGDPAPAPAEPVAEPAAVAAAATPRPRPRRIPQPAPSGTPSRLSLVAAADVGGGFTSGQELQGFGQVAEAFISRSKGFPSGVARTPNVRHQHSVASIRRNFQGDPDGLHVQNQDYDGQQAVFDAASREQRLSGGSLVAAGGWCAPSETLYGLPSDETLDGIIDLPVVGVNRGGINFTPGPDFSDIYESAGFHQTELQAIAGTEKPCIEVDCPDFDEIRLDAVGYCVKAPLLTRAAYPEVIQRWLEGTVVANAHKVAGRIIQSMRTALGSPVAPVLTGQPITWSLLTALELSIEGQREAWRLSDGETIEVKAPRWLRVAIRADLANRVGTGADAVTNAQIAEHFASIGAVVQFVLNYQPLTDPKRVAAFPTTVEVMVYPAGTFVRGNADVVSLDTVYDTADLQSNVYTAAFVEDGVLVAKMKHGGVRLQLPLNVTGRTGANDIVVPWGRAS